MVYRVKYGQSGDYNNPVFVVYTFLCAGGKTLDGRFILNTGLQMSAWRYIGIVFTVICLTCLLALLCKSLYFDRNIQVSWSPDILLLSPLQYHVYDQINVFLMRCYCQHLLIVPPFYFTIVSRERCYW